MERLREKLLLKVLDLPDAGTGDAMMSPPASAPAIMSKKMPSRTWLYASLYHNHFTSGSEALWVVSFPHVLIKKVE